jgi:hypothetical protein
MKKFSIIVLSAAIAGSSLLCAAEVDQRQENQKDRVQQGVASGELTKGEAAGIRKDEKAIHQEVKADRAANGGKLTPAEKRKVNRQLNKESRKIHRKKHNKVVSTDTK